MKQYRIHLIYDHWIENNQEFKCTCSKVITSLQKGLNVQVHDVMNICLAQHDLVVHDQQCFLCSIKVNLDESAYKVCHVENAVHH